MFPEMNDSPVICSYLLHYMLLNSVLLKLVCFDSRCLIPNTAIANVFFLLIKTKSTSRILRENVRTPCCKLYPPIKTLLPQSEHFRCVFVAHRVNHECYRKHQPNMLNAPQDLQDFNSLIIDYKSKLHSFKITNIDIVSRDFSTVEDIPYLLSRKFTFFKLKLY